MSSARRDPDALLAALRAADPVNEAEAEGHLRNGGRERIAARIERTDEAEPRVRGGRPTLRIARLAVAAAGSAIVLFAAVAILRSAEQASDLGPANEGVSSFAAVAAEQPVPEGFEYLEWEFHWVRAKRGIDRRIQIWAGHDERYERRRFEAQGDSWGDEGFLDREAGLACGVERPRDEPACSPFEPDLRGVRDPWEALWFQAAELPTDAEELKALLEQEVRDAYEAGLSPPEGPDGGPTMGPSEGVGGFGPTGPWDDLSEKVQATLYAEGLFAELVALLANPYAPPDLRAAGFEVLASIDGIELFEDREDRLGRRAAVIGLTRPWFVPTPPPPWHRYELYIDPYTSQVLELRTLASPETKGARDPADIPRRSFRISSYELVTDRQAVDELPPEAERFRLAAAHAATLAEDDQAVQEGDEPAPEDDETTGQSAETDDAPIQHLSLAGHELRSRNPGHPPDEVHLRTRRTALPVGTTEVTIGTCPTGLEAVGLEGPGSIDGNPSTDLGFRYGSKQRSIIVTVRNTAEAPVVRRFRLICAPQR